MAWVIDLDGVVWRGGDLIPGSPEAVARLRDAGEQVLFVTNNSEPRVSDQEAKLASFGIDAEGAVVTSALAAASMLEPDSTALACGGPGVIEALERRGITVRREAPVDTVVVGFHRHFDYEGLRAAHHAVWKGARLLGTNADATYPSADGPIPGAGSILAAVATAAGVEPEVAGKPFEAIIALVQAEVGEGNHIVVGDRASTDGKLAAGLGARFALVMSGVTSPDDPPSEPEPDLVADDLASLVDAELGPQAPQ
ncbi:MAG: HAD-IIA family hydrolase [Acidimicrobiales bacterium]